MHLPRSIFLSLIIMSAGGGTLAWGLDWTPDISTAKIAPAPVPWAEMAALSTARQTDTADLRQRPLFTPGRRPYAPTAAADPSAPVPVETTASIPVPIVLGIATSGEQAVAIVAEADGARPRSVVLGDKVKDWCVIAIDRGSVTFRSLTDGSAAAETVADLKKAADTELQPDGARQTPRVERTATPRQPPRQTPGMPRT
jgi:hypothetical protein